MSLSVYLTAVRPVDVFNYNITHNLNRMAQAAGIYQHLWRPKELGITTASQLIIPLGIGLKELQDNPEKYKSFNPENKWGDYNGLVKFVTEYLQACIDNPDATIEVSR